jgi:hypothetical protein
MQFKSSVQGDSNVINNDLPVAKVHLVASTETVEGVGVVDVLVAAYVVMHGNQVVVRTNTIGSCDSRIEALVWSRSVPEWALEMIGMVAGSEMAVGVESPDPALMIAAFRPGSHSSAKQIGIAKLLAMCLPDIVAHASSINLSRQPMTPAELVSVFL